jgi:hypothetical protein
MEQNLDPNPNPNPQPPWGDSYIEINQCLHEIINLIGELKNTREPCPLSLATPKAIVSFISHNHGQLSHIYEYRVSMREYYSSFMRKEEMKDLHITKVIIVQLFIEPRTNHPPSYEKYEFCMDKCTFQLWKDDWMDICFIVFDKSPYNNRKIPLYFPSKLST